MAVGTRLVNYGIPKMYDKNLLKNCKPISIVSTDVRYLKNSFIILILKNIFYYSLRLSKQDFCVSLQ